jgi:uncharacterized membrane protein YebE (DUF533 family)
MDTRNILDQLLKAGSDLLQNTGADQQQSGTQRSAGIGDLIAKNKGGLAAGGVLGLLLGSKTGRKIGGGALKYGSLAALGAIAYKAYSNWQDQQNSPKTSAPQPINALPAPELEQHSRAVLSAMIGAAKADGHIDAQERALIDQGVAALTDDPQLQVWFDQELNKPLDPAEVARHAKSPEMAAEMYLASVLVVDQESYMEKAYLEELARQLNIDASLKAELEAQVKATQ